MAIGNRTQRWCVYIDILGFSDLWETEEYKVLCSLGELMRAIYRIGTRVYPNEGDRLFVHHMGDGFAIVNDFGEASFERPIAVAIALMRCVASTGTFAAAAIAEGKFADVTGCYPQEVRNGSQDHGVVGLGDGLMTLSSVMGTAFIRAYRLNSVAPSGPFLTLSASHRDGIPDGMPTRQTESRNSAPLLSIDWVRAESTLLTEIQRNAGLNAPTPTELVQAVEDYCTGYSSVREKWRIHLCKLLEIKV